MAQSAVPPTTDSDHVDDPCFPVALQDEGRCLIEQPKRVGVIFVYQIGCGPGRQAFVIRDPRALDRPEQLTGRQREVLQMLAEGRSMKEIAYVLEIAHRTVRFHKYRIMEDLGITTNSDLVKYAIRHGMISAA